MNIIAMTMVYNEGAQLQRWLAHYGAQLGQKSLLIIDHGSNDRSTESLGLSGRLLLPRKEFDDGQRAEFISSLQKDLFIYYDAVIYTDCDELLVADPRRYRGLTDYVEQMTSDCSRAVGLDVFQSSLDDAPLSADHYISKQRPFSIFKSSLCKPLITRAPLKWAPGFHACDKQVPIDTSLFLFHTKNADLTSSLRRLDVTRNLRWSEKSLESHWGAHQRRTDQALLNDVFHDPNNVRKNNGENVAFEFDQLAAEFSEGSRLIDGMWHCHNFNGPVFKVPDWLRDSY